VKTHSTTVCIVKRDGKTVIGADGQVSKGTSIIKSNVKKVRKICNDSVIVGFAGSVSDCFTLLESLEAFLNESNDFTKSVIDFTKYWRTEKSFQKLSASLIVANKDNIYQIEGDGTIIEPENGICSVGSGSDFAFASAIAYSENNELTAKQIVEKSLTIASNLCVYTNKNFQFEEL